MSKNTFYFSHDYNARMDDKIKKLIRKCKMEGYGIYWSIVEDLYNNSNALETDYDGIAYDLRVDPKTVKLIVNEFDLFVVKGEIFGSLAVQERLDKRDEKSKKARDNARKRWDKENANALREECEGNAIKERKGKERKRKEKKLKEILMSEIEISDVPNKEIEYFQIAKSFYDLIEKNLDEISAPKINLKKQKYITWITSIRLMMKNKEADIDQFRSVFLFLQTSEFWKPNIQSPKKLRMQFTRLYSESKKAIKNGKFTLDKGKFEEAFNRNSEERGL